MSKPFTWSWSQLENFEGCPRRWFLESYAKVVPYVQNEAAAWGDKVHKALEKRIGPAKIPLPSNMVQYEKFAVPVVQAEAAGAKLSLEQKLAINTAWEPAGYFRDQSTWCRSIADWVAEKGSHAIVGDWKTGKPKQGSDQLRLSAAVIMAHRPYLQKATVSFIWIGDVKGPPTTEVIHRAELPEIRASFLPRVKRMTDAIDADRFLPKPSGLCGWCSVGRKHCEHWTGNGRT